MRALSQDALGRLIASDGQRSDVLEATTAATVIASDAVVVCSERALLRRALRMGAVPGRAVCTKHQAALLKQAGCAVPKLPADAPVEAVAASYGDAMRSAGLDRVARLESSFLPVCERLQLAGLPIDLAGWDGVLDEAQRRAEAARQGLASIIGRDLTGAPAVEPGERDKLIAYFRSQGFQLKNLSKSVLAELDHPAAKALLVWREASKLTSTYESYTDRQVNGRIFGHFEPLGAQTGRMSCGHPNLQNIPAVLRPCVVAPPGRVLLSADYSGCELRIAAALSGDPEFRAALMSADFHSTVASRLFGKPVSKTENPQLRHAAKAINFGLIYGMGAKALAASLKIGTDEARDLLQRYFLGFPGLAAWRERAQQEGARTLTLETVSGRRLKMEKNSGTLALNYPVQGGGADLIKWAAVRFDRLLPELPGRPVLVNMVHDELLVEVDESAAEAVRGALVEAMMGAGVDLFPSVPMAVDSALARRWDH